MFGFGKKKCKEELESLKSQMQKMIVEIRKLTEAIIAGQLDTRANPDKFQGEFAQVVQSVNDTLDAVTDPLNVTAEYVDRISKGDIPNTAVAAASAVTHRFAVTVRLLTGLVRGEAVSGSSR